MYGDLVYAAGLSAGDLDKYFKDAGFGVRSGQVERAYAPRGDVTIVRDSGFGVPHIYGETRAGALFRLGYAGAEDRLFVMDVLRNRAAPSCPVRRRLRGQPRDGPRPVAPGPLHRGRPAAPVRPGGRGLWQRRHATAGGRDRLRGRHQRLHRRGPVNPLKMPGEYAAIGRPTGPVDWKVTDVIATASLIGGIFGKGGGRELDSAQLLRAAQGRFGRRAGKRVWADLRTAEDPGAPVTVHGKKRFRYRAEPRRLRRGSRPSPTPARSRARPEVAAAERRHAQRARASAACCASRARARTRCWCGARVGVRPADRRVRAPDRLLPPQLLMDMDVHGPGIDARGATFAGIGLYVQLGRGRDYAWSATSAGQDIIDTFALELCDPGGATPTRARCTTSSAAPASRWRCSAGERLGAQPSRPDAAGHRDPARRADQAGHRDRAAATVGGRPVAYTSLRSTYFHEADSALGFTALQRPGAIREPQDFKRAASKIGFTFNWFYVDALEDRLLQFGQQPGARGTARARLPGQRRTSPGGAGTRT